jgi:hypothetical protein
LNRDGWYVSILNSQRGADQKEIVDGRLAKSRDRTFLADKLWYLLKSPKKAYRIYRTERMTPDGELVPCFRQRKSQLRKGDRITLFHLMKNLHFSESAAAGGDGIDIMQADQKTGCAYPRELGAVVMVDRATGVWPSLPESNMYFHRRMIGIGVAKSSASNAVKYLST